MADKPAYEELLQRTKELEQDLEVFRTLVERSRDLFYRTDLEGRILYISPSVYKLMGYTVEEAVGMITSEEMYLLPEDREAFVAKLMEDEHVTNFEVLLKRKDGSTWWASTNARLFRDTDGNIIGVEGTARDITELKAADSSLRMMEERFRLAFQTSPDSINLSRVSDGVFIDVNDGFTELTGFTREEVIGKSALEIDFWKDPDDRKRLVDGLMKNGYVKNLEAQFVKKTGEAGVGLVSARTLRIGDEEVILSVARDITERKQAAQALQQSQELNRLIMEQVNAHLWTVDRDLRFTSWSGTGSGMLDNVIEPKGQRIQSILGTDDENDPAVAAMHRAISGQSARYPYHFEEGDWESRVEPLRDADGNIIGCVGVSLDVTERKQMEKALEESEKKFRTVFENAAIGRSINAVDGRFLSVNDSLCRITGYSRDELLERTWMDIVHPDDFAATFNKNQNVIEGGTDFFTHSMKAVYKNGNPNWVRVNVVLTRDEKNNPQFFFADIEDITEQKSQEQSLKKSEEKYRQLFQRAPVMLHTLDRDGYFVEVNEMWLNTFGYRREDVIGKFALDFYTDEARGKAVGGLARRYEAEGYVRDEPFQMAAKDGTLLDVLVTAYSEKDPDGNVIRIRVAVVDVTEQNRVNRENEKLEQQLMLSQKLEAIGRLAGGVAHDLNNMLSPILGYSELLLMDTPKHDPRKEALQQIRKAGVGARELVHQLLAFSRKQTLEFRLLDVNEIVGGFEKLLRRTIREDIEIDLRLKSDLPLIMADVGQIEQVIMNLSINAADAMPGGGRLTIETAQVELDENYAATRPEIDPGQYIMIGFSDTGIGMSEEVGSQIFEPFFFHQGRTRDRPRACNRLRHRQTAQRQHLGLQRARKGDDLQGVPARIRKDRRSRKGRQEKGDRTEGFGDDTYGRGQRRRAQDRIRNIE